MARPTRKKPSKNLLDFVRHVRDVTGLTESEFAHELGLPKPTIKAFCNPKAQRRASEDHLALMLLAFGAEFLESTPTPSGSIKADLSFAAEDYEKWQQIQEMSLPQIRGLIDSSITNTKTLLAAAASKKRLLVALYLLEVQLRKWTQQLDLVDDIAAAEASHDLNSTLSQPEKITEAAILRYREFAGL